MKITPLETWLCRKIGAQGTRLSRADLEICQLEQLRKTIALAREKSPFYRRHLATVPSVVTSLDDLRHYPLTSSEEVRQNPLQFVCVSQDEIQRVVTLQTSGTTGEPKRVFFTAADQELTIDFFQHGMSTFAEAGEQVLILLPVEKPGSVGDLLRLGLERLGAEPLPYGPVRDPLAALEFMQRHRADCLVGAPVQVLGLALRWKPGFYKPRSILLSTDNVPQAIVDTLKDIWNCDVFNHYGTTEMGLGGGVECEAHSGYHLREADLYFEIIDPVSGEALPDGEYGEVVFTTLTREGMPLIRYRMGDRSRFITETCPCGTVMKTLERVHGRYEGFIQVNEGILRLADLDEALFSIKDLLNYTAVLDGSFEKPSLTIDALMLTPRESIREIYQALCTVESLEGMELVIHCRYAPEEAGSLQKRTILDKRNKPG